LKVYRGLEKFKAVNNPVVTTGTFDGAHVGHRKILDRLKEVALASKGETVVLTFYPHPRIVLFPEDNELKLLTTQEEKIKLLEQAGVDHLVIYPFTKQFSRLTSVQFVRNILVNKIGTKKLVIGYNHHFGRNREGSFEHLKEFGPVYGFDVEEIQAMDVDQVEVSSTKIREALLKGDMKTAAKYLGYNYALQGMVVRGRQLGNTIGYATANLEIQDKYKLIPADGVYAVTVSHQNNTYKGMMNIGMAPTVGGTQRKVEVHVFDFNQDIYGQQLDVSIVGRIRDEKKFPDLESLKKQLDSDKQKSLTLLA